MAKSTVPLDPKLTVISYPVTTNSDDARAYFTQGLVLGYGFNHADAEKSFREAARLDPEFAMAYWGSALVLGPNINMPMQAPAYPKAYADIQKAVALAGKASEKEQALIHALAKRYGPEAVEDRSELDKAYADAMRMVAGQYADDPTILALYAEALMDLHPWDTYTADKKEKPWTPQIVQVLEAAIALDRDHPLPNHLYIHAIEESAAPERAVHSADVLLEKVPASGHLIHMAGHAYFAAGFYHDCVRANEIAIEADREFFAEWKSTGVYPLAYAPHNFHYLWSAYAMEGQSTDALRIAREVSGLVDRKMMFAPGLSTLQHFWSLPFYTLVRFGQWEAILAEPKPDAELVYPTGVWHYARAMALIRTGKLAEADAELAEVKRIAADPVIDNVTIWDINKTGPLLEIAAKVIEGELAHARGDSLAGVKHLQAGIALEDGLNYDEPPSWHQPVRQNLGAVLLDMKRMEAAEATFRADLAKNPENGWALYGLKKSMEGRTTPLIANDNEQRFLRAWARADVVLEGSRF